MTRVAICVGLESIERFAEVVELALCTLSLLIDGVVFKWIETFLRGEARTVALVPCAATA